MLVLLLSVSLLFTSVKSTSNSNDTIENNESFSPSCILSDTDFRGSLIDHFVIKETVMGCIDLCKETEACETWTYITNDSPRIEYRNRCYLRSSDGGAYSSVGTVSGRKHDCTECFDFGKGYQGGDIQGGYMREITTIEACQNACQMNPDCFVWMIDYRDPYLGCWLKYSRSTHEYVSKYGTHLVSGPKYCSGCTAGYVHLYNSCYHFSTHQYSQDDAAVMCEEWGASLLTLESYAENQAIKEYLPQVNDVEYWTSLRLDIGSCVWHWDRGTGAHITFADWCGPSEHGYCVVEPDGGDDSVVLGNSPYKHTWIGRRTTDIRAYICKAPLAV